MRMFTRPPEMSDVLNRLDEGGDRLMKLETEMEQVREDIGAILEKLEMMNTKVGADIAYLRGRVESCEAVAGGLVGDIGATLATIIKLARKVRR